MLFENLVSLIDGELKNEPSIASFSKIAFEAKRVKRGDLFFGDAKQIDEALKNGAYGIVSNRFRVKDREIAWIRVKDIKEAKEKLLRYFIIKSAKPVVNLSNVESKIAKAVELDRNYYISKDIQKALNDLEKDDFMMIIIEDEELFRRLDLPSFEIIKRNEIDVIKATLFLTTFIYRQRRYKEIKLPMIFKSEFERVLNLFDDIGVEYSVQKLNFIEHFKPLFVDSSYRLLSFGQSTKVIIVEIDQKLLKREIEYIKNRASWAKLLLLLPAEIKLSEEIDIEVKYYKNYADIKKQNIFNYNFVIMLDADRRYEKYLQKKAKEIKNRLF